MQRRKEVKEKEEICFPPTEREELRERG